MQLQRVAKSDEAIQPRRELPVVEVPESDVRISSTAAVTLQDLSAEMLDHIVSFIPRDEKFPLRFIKIFMERTYLP